MITLLIKTNMTMKNFIKTNYDNKISVTNVQMLAGILSPFKDLTPHSLVYFGGFLELIVIFHK